ncbi:unnamed protein product [Lota lota]
MPATTVFLDSMIVSPWKNSNPSLTRTREFWLYEVTCKLQLEKDLRVALFDNDMLSKEDRNDRHQSGANRFPTRH